MECKLVRLVTPNLAEKTNYLKEEITPEGLQTLKDTCAQSMFVAQPRATQENDAVPKIAPKWLKYDRQVSNDR
jgi:hypothetical protein